jgi:RimK family alpha-L-glutamate ligase
VSEAGDGAAPDVLVLGAGGWHWDRLRAAIEREGLGVGRLSFTSCSFSIGETGSGILLGSLIGLPRAVLVRFIPAGTLEQITFRLAILHALEAAGVLVLNPPRAIERCVDKGATSFLLARAGVPTPPTWVVDHPDLADAIAQRETQAGYALVLKPLFGAQGKGLRLLTPAADLPGPEEVNGIWYLQRYVGATSGWRDYRVLVVEGEPIAAMARHGRQWITNIRQGGRPERVSAEGELGRLAVAAAEAVGCAHAGVDLIEDQRGRLTVLEVNSMPAWRGLQSVAEIDIAGRMAARIATRLRR